MIELHCMTNIMKINLVISDVLSPCLRRRPVRHHHQRPLGSDAAQQLPCLVQLPLRLCHRPVCHHLAQTSLWIWHLCVWISYVLTLVHLVEDAAE